MKKAVKIKKNDYKKEVPSFLNELKFWKQIALQQQVFLHAKNNT